MVGLTTRLTVDSCAAAPPIYETCRARRFYPPVQPAAHMTSNRLKTLHSSGVIACMSSAL